MTSRSSLLSRRPLVAVAGSVALAASTLAAAPSATAGGDSGGSGGPTVVAHGLNSPRQLSFGPHGALYVTEAGTGGSGPCVTGETGKVCFGRTGSVTRIKHGSQHPVLRHPPSLAGGGRAEPPGPAPIPGRRARGHRPSLG